MRCGLDVVYNCTVAATSNAEEIIAERYRVTGILGKGGMGQVLEVLDTATDETVALKQLALSEKSQDKRSALFQREFHTLTQLAHPNVVRVFDYGVDNETPYYTMEVLDGQDLREVAPLPWKRCCEILVDLCSALAVVHSRGLVHRDVTPRNVLISAESVCKLIDFGALAPMGACSNVVGTPPYVAPELIDRRTIDARADIFSLGALTYWALTGRHAFPASRMRDLTLVWEQTPPPPSHYGPDIPGALDELVMSMLSREPEARPTQVAEVRQRAATVAGLATSAEAGDVQAHLTTPALAGREELLGEFRLQLGQMKAGRGTSLMLRGDPGMGRTRMLQALGLEAKLQGCLVLPARVLRTDNEDTILLMRLMQTLQTVAGERADNVAAGIPGIDALWPPPSREDDDDEQVFPTADQQLQEAAVQLIEQLSDLVPVVLTVDDIHLAEPFALQFLGRLARSTIQRPIVVVTSAAQVAADGSDSPALQQMAARSEIRSLEPLEPDETYALLASIFGDSERLQVIVDWAQGVSGGNPETCMQLAHHVVEQGVVDFRGGRFELPTNLVGLDLPQDLEQALSLRLTKLSKPALNIARVLASATRFAPLDLADIVAVMAGHQGDSETFDGLDELTGAQLVELQGEGYVFTDTHVADVVRHDSPAGVTRRWHAGLGSRFEARGDGFRALSAYHFLEAEDLPEAHRVLNTMTEQAVGASSVNARVTRSEVGAPMYERLLAYTKAEGFRPATHFRYRKSLLQIASVTDRSLVRYADETLEQLQYDVGLDLWDAFADIEEEVPRLLKCLGAASERYEETPRDEQGLEPGVAIKELATCCAILTGVYGTCYDVEGMARLPSIIRPLRGLVPVLGVVYQQTQLGADQLVRGMFVADQREQVSAMLREPLDGMDNLTRTGLLQIGNFYLGLEYAADGLDAALDLADEIETEPIYALLGKQLRMVAALYRGDFAGSQAARQDRDRLGLVSADCEEHVQLSIGFEARAYHRCGDLLGVGQALRITEGRARDNAGWQPWAHVVRALYRLLCDQFDSALEEIRSGQALAPVAQHGAWLPLAEAEVEALMMSGHYDETIKRAEAVEATLADLYDTPKQAARVMGFRAVAMARLGRIDEARAVLAPMIEDVERRAPDGLVLGELQEALAWVELAAKDEVRAEQAAAAMRAVYRRGRYPGLAARVERLSRAGRKQGLLTTGDASTDMTSATGSSSTLATDSLMASQMQSQMSGYSLVEQYQHLLALVLGEVALNGGYLYRHTREGKLVLLAHRGVTAPNPHLDVELQQHLEVPQEASEDGETSLETATATATAGEDAGFLKDAKGGTYFPVALRDHAGERRIIGVVALRTMDVPELPHAFVRAVAHTLHTLTSKRKGT